VLIACAGVDGARAAALREKGAEIVELPNAIGKVDLPALLLELGRRGINEVLAEAGFKLNGSLLREGCVDEILLYLAPSLIGDAARGLFDLPALESLDGKRRLAWHEVRQVGADLRVLARFAA
jgi:diaminohydroxyphosphoribosylaminopyrimidine deaminase/5-amino-6-(5-phosphoribosylamino)uracil reductase